MGLIAGAVAATGGETDRRKDTPDKEPVRTAETVHKRHARRFQHANHTEEREDIDKNVNPEPFIAKNDLNKRLRSDDQPDDKRQNDKRLKGVQPQERALGEFDIVLLAGKHRKRYAGSDTLQLH